MRILQVLETKVAEGVEVRFMYDGMGNLLQRCRTAMRKRCRRKVSSARFLRRCVRLSRVTRITAITGKSV